MQLRPGDDELAVLVEHAPAAQHAHLADHARPRGAADDAQVRVELASDRPAWVDIDGEAPGFAPAEFQVQPSALPIWGLLPEAL